jgi:hypothetical protein
MAKESGAQAAPRTLAEVLRSWPADRLGRLLRERPDLATPAPHDSAQLASRAATRASVSRALDQLTHGELLVLDALVIAGQTTPEGLSALVRVSDVRSTAVSDALAHLENLALCWRAPEGLRPLTTIAELLVGTDGTSGLRPIGPDPRPSDAIAADLEAVSTEARALLAHVVAAGGTGRTQAARTIGDPAEARTPVEELLARGLLVPAGSGTVVVPGEVGLALHGGRTTDEPVDVTPELATGSRDPKLVARAAAGAAFELTRRVELLLDRWGTHPPAALRTGGLGVRDLKAASTLLGVEAGEAALIIEVCFAAGLLATGTTADEVDAWLPTEAFDAWSTLGSAPRWVRLAGAWLASPRTPALVGTRDSGGKAINALAPELSSGLQAQTRRAALEEIAALPEGDVLATGTGVPSLVARIRWLRPRRPTSRDAQVAASVTEAGMLGFAGLGAVPAYARALLHGDAEEAVRLLDPLLPQPVDHLLVQADLTAVAPGPLTSEISRALHLLADVESRGGATVYRFGKDSLRRAFDAGWSATEVHAYLEGLSRTPLPQPLTYLVDDVARTFGTVRVGHAESFLRADDEGALTELMHHPKAASLRLRRIAPIRDASRVANSRRTTIAATTCVRRPRLIVQSDKTLLLEVDHPQAAECAAAIAPFAELERSRAHPHLSPDPARAVERPRRRARRRAGHRRAAAAQPVCRAALPARRRRRDDGALWPADHGEASGPRVGAAHHRPPRAGGGAPRQEGSRRCSANASTTTRSSSTLRARQPQAGAAQDSAGRPRTSPAMSTARPTRSLREEGWTMRPYQRQAVEGFWHGGSGSSCCRAAPARRSSALRRWPHAKATTLILVTNTVSARQWKDELLRRTSLTAEKEIGEYSGPARRSARSPSRPTKC